MDRIVENINSVDLVEDRLRKDCNGRVKRRGRRGRPKGTGRKHAEGSVPKSFRHFSPLAHGLVKALLLGGQFKESESEIVEEALVRLAQARSNEIPGLAARLKRAGR